MTMGEYDDTDENSKCCDDFHWWGCDVVEDKIEDKARKWKCELKNSGYSCWNIFETFEIECWGEDIGDKDDKEDIERAYTDLIYHGSYSDHLMTQKYYYPTDKTCEEIFESQGIEMWIVRDDDFPDCRRGPPKNSS